MLDENGDAGIVHGAPDMERLKAVFMAAITSTRPRPLPLPRPFLAGRPGPLPRPLTLFLVAGGISTHDTPWSLTFLLRAERDGDSGDSGVGGGGVRQSSALFAGEDRETSGVGGGGVRQTSALVLLAGEHIEISEETLRVLF